MVVVQNYKDLESIWAQGAALSKTYEDILQDYTTNNDEISAVKLQNVRNLIIRNIQKSCELLSIEFTGIDWNNFDESFHTWRSLCFTGYNEAFIYNDIICSLHGNIDNYCLISDKEEAEETLSLMIEEFIELIYGLMLNEP